MEDAHAMVLDLRKGNPEDLKEFDESDTTEVKETKGDKTPTPIEDRVSFFAVYDGHGGELTCGGDGK